MSLATRCPNCSGDLAVNIAPHCEGRSTPCGWIKHKPCGAVVDPKTGRFNAKA